MARLPCFTNISNITNIHCGDSHTSYKVTNDSRDYFVKQLNSPTAESLAEVSRLFASHGVTPELLYHDKEWLITHFIEGETLNESPIASDQRIKIATNILHAIHRVSSRKNPNLGLELLDIVALIKQLVSTPCFNAEQRQYVAQALESLPALNENLAINTSHNVICHGDLNFGNIMLETTAAAQAQHTAKYWAIDFECTCIAPRAFDIAMTMAINLFSVAQITRFLEYYNEGQAAQEQVNSAQAHGFLGYCYLLNGLWYVSQAKSLGKSVLEAKASEQFSALALLAELPSFPQ